MKSAPPIAPPGCPDLAFSTIAADRIRMLSATRVSSDLVTIRDCMLLYFYVLASQPGPTFGAHPGRIGRICTTRPVTGRKYMERRTKPKIFLPSFLILLVRIERARLHTGPPPQSRVRWYKFNTNPVYPTCLSAKISSFRTFPGHKARSLRSSALPKRGYRTSCPS